MDTKENNEYAIRNILQRVEGNHNIMSGQSL